MTNSDTDNVVLQGRTPTADERFYVEWGRETFKRNLTFTNEVLRQCLTTALALAGGSIAFLDDKVVGPAAREIAVVLFMIAIIVALFGILPYEGVGDVRQPDVIREHKERALQHKRCLLKITASAIVAGLVVAFIGRMCH